MNHSFKRLISRALVVVAASLPLASFAAGDGEYPLDPFPVEKLQDPASLQNGAKLFVNYCLSCHSASAMRYNRLRDIGLDEDQIKANLLFTAEKVGDPMTIAMRPDDAKTWFGAMPPDLSLVARSRASGAGSGADWLFTYLRAVVVPTGVFAATEDFGSNGGRDGEDGLDRRIARAASELGALLVSTSGSVPGFTAPAVDEVGKVDRISEDSLTPFEQLLGNQLR